MSSDETRLCLNRSEVLGMGGIRIVLTASDGAAAPQRPEEADLVQGHGHGHLRSRSGHCHRELRVLRGEGERQHRGQALVVQGGDQQRHADDQSVGRRGYHDSVAGGLEIAHLPGTWSRRREVRRRLSIQERGNG